MEKKKEGWNRRGLSIESDADGFKFSFEESPLLSTFGGIEDHQDEITGLIGTKMLAAEVGHVCSRIELLWQPK